MGSEMCIRDRPSPRSRSSTFGPPGAPVLPDLLSCSLAERHTTAGVVFSLVVGVASSAAAFRLLREQDLVRTIRDTGEQ